MSKRPDILIVGGGSAGSLLANRLSQDPSVHVTLIEAGSRVSDPDVVRPELWPFIQGRDFDWAYTTTPQAGLAGRRLAWARGKGWGGSSNLHAMAHMRGARADFDSWVQATGDSRWSWEALLPYFRRMETFVPSEGGGDSKSYNAAGRLPVLRPDPSLSSPVVTSYLDAWASLGVPRIADHNGGEMIGATPNSLTINEGRRVTTAEAYLDPVRNRSNLTLLDNATVHRLRVRHGRVVGVEMTREDRDTVAEATTIILTAGAIGTPLLLMRSGIGDPEVLHAAGVHPILERHGVGRNLHDHLLGSGILYRARRAVPASNLQLSESMTYLSAAGLHVTEGAPDIVVGCVVGPSTSEVYASAGDGIDKGYAYTLLFGVTNPSSRGSLSISGPSVTDPPTIDPNYLDTERDRKLFRVALEHAELVGGTDAMAEWRAEQVLPAAPFSDESSADAFIARAATTHHHPVGTCRMGGDDDSIVDAELNVRGLEGLSIVDASVIPSITTGPVHAPVLAIAEAYADRIGA